MIFERSMLVLAPPKKLTVSEWADANRQLSSEASAEAGRWRTDRAEYQRGIMDAISDPSVETVVWMSSAQVGKTEFILNTIGYYIDQDPSPILILQPTLEMGQAFSKDRIAPMCRDTEVLSEKVSSSNSKDSGTTILHKSFVGGHLTIAGANSPASLASRPVRVVMCDEVDRYPASAGTEGDPVELAFKRTTTFWNKKKILTSTPTDENSRILKAYNSSDKRKYYVPCVECGYKQLLKWSNVVWDENNPSDAKYHCDNCGVAWSDAVRWRAIQKGEWVAENPNIKKTAGFFLNEIYSPWVQLGVMAERFIEAKKSPLTLKTFINTSLGEIWKDEGDGVNEDKIKNKNQKYTLPKKALVLTCGVDVQDDRLEGEIKAWGAGEECWGYKPFRIEGKPDQDVVWKELDDILTTQYTRDDGIKLSVLCTCIDSGGHFTNEVYKFAKPREHRRVFAIKGANTAGKPIVSRPSIGNSYKAKLFSIGTDTAKELIYSRLQQDEGNGQMHFNELYDDEYFAQLTGEKIQTSYKKGFMKREWVKTRRRNEALDYTVYNLAALYILNPNFEKIAEQKKETTIPKKVNAVLPKKRSWANGYK